MLHVRALLLWTRKQAFCKHIAVSQSEASDHSAVSPVFTSRGQDSFAAGGLFVCLHVIRLYKHIAGSRREASDHS